MNRDRPPHPSSVSISVIVPLYNGERYVGDALRSVLVQTQSVNEIILVDDGSTDNGPEVAEALSPLVSTARQSHAGPAAARNRGIMEARGDLLAFLDADDVWLPTKIERQVRTLDETSWCEAVMGQVENFISPDLDECEQAALSKAATRRGEIHVGAMLIRREALLRIGLFDTRWEQGEFTAWWAAAQSAGLGYITLPDLVLRRRLHMHNLTRRKADEYNGTLLSLLREHMEKRR